MDQIATIPELKCQPTDAVARKLGYDREGIAFLGLSRLKGVGFHTLKTLGGRAGIGQLLENRNVGEIIRRTGLVGQDGSNERPWDAFSQLIATLGCEVVKELAARGVRLLFAGDPDFPPSLTALPDELRPHWLFVAGNLDLLGGPSIAVVGTRDPTEIGDFLAKYAVQCARELNAPVISGLALGIDRMVHEWCLRLSLPTISVLGTGILVPYPAKHAPLGQAIVAAGGTVVTEYLPMQGPSGQQFVWRNRLQAALGRATIPVEWKRKSGTAHTVRFSRTLGRPVIGMELDGVDPHPEAGEADQHFRVPIEHSKMIDALQKALLRGAPMHDAQQTDLFQ